MNPICENLPQVDYVVKKNSLSQEIILATLSEGIGMSQKVKHELYPSTLLGWKT